MEKTYKDFLAEVKTKNPDLPFNQQQKLASDLYKESQILSVPGAIPDAVPVSDVYNRALSMQIEAFIRGEGKVPDINRITEGLVAFGIKDYVIHEAGKDGVNTKVFATGFPGIRVPYENFFLVFK